MAGNDRDPEVSYPALRPQSSTHNDAGYNPVFVPEGLLIKGCNKGFAELLTPTTMAQTEVEMLMMTQASRTRSPQW